MHGEAGRIADRTDRCRRPAWTRCPQRAKPASVSEDGGAIFGDVLVDEGRRDRGMRRTLDLIRPGLGYCIPRDLMP
jgi:hypothetical protein